LRRSRSKYIRRDTRSIPQPRTIPLPRVVRSGHKGPTLTSTSNLPSIRSPHLSSRPSFPFRQWRTPLRATRTTGVSRCAARDPNTFVERRARFPSHAPFRCTSWSIGSEKSQPQLPPQPYLLSAFLPNSSSRPRAGSAFLCRSSPVLLSPTNSPYKPHCANCR